MAEPPVIRQAAADDATGIRECLAEAFAEFRERYTAAAWDDTVLAGESLPERLAKMTMYVADTDDGAVAGTVCWQKLGEGEGHIRGMSVRPSHRGSGRADRLLAHAEADMRAAGSASVTLDTTAFLHAAIRFYEKHGYRRTGRSRICTACRSTSLPGSWSSAGWTSPESRGQSRCTRDTSGRASLFRRRIHV